MKTFEQLREQHERYDMADAILKHLANKTGYFVIIRECQECGKFLGATDGQGVSGVSSGLCPECTAKIKTRLNIVKSQRGSSPIWPMIGALLVGMILAAEYIYSIIMYAR